MKRGSLQVFPKGSNAAAAAILIVFVSALVGLGVVAAVLSQSNYATTENLTLAQPVPFSHKHHVAGLGIDCQYCHTSVMESQFAGIPPTHTCMTCHSQVWTNAQMLAPVRESLKTDQPIRWQRVHDLADYVYFNHSVHVNNGIGCESCHGRVDRMPLMEQREPLAMQWCLGCHTDPAPRLRPPDEITTMGFVPGPETPPGHVLMEFYEIETTGLTDCTTCHR